MTSPLDPITRITTTGSGGTQLSAREFDAVWAAVSYGLANFGS